MPAIRVWTGRAHRLLTPVIQAVGKLHAQQEPCILLVPEQFTLQAERELLGRLHLSGFFTLDVLSPSRLSRRVLDSVGADERAPLSAAGRMMAVSQALERCEARLQYYRSSARRLGFAQKFSTLVADLKRGGLTPSQLAEYALTLPEGMRRAKFADLAIIFETYEATLAGRFGDSEDQLRYLSARLPESNFLTGKHLFVYGFDALPEPLIALLAVAGGLCESLTVALLCDSESAPDGDLYLPVRQSIARFEAAVRERGLSLVCEQLPAEPLPHAPAIRHLEETLFAYPERRYPGEQRTVFLSQHMSPFEEAAMVSRQIVRLCAQGMDIERIAVLYPAQNGYAFAVNAALADSGLPFYTDEKLPASSHALARFLLAALRAMANEYRREDVVAVMKSGYSPLRFEEACALENYAREFGINRQKWLSPFTRGGEARIAQAEPMRQRLMEPLAKARAAIVTARDSAASLAAVMGLLTDVNAYDTLLSEEQALLARGMLVRAGQNSQMWQTLLELMDQLHALSDTSRIPLSHIADRFAGGLAAVSLSALPPASGMLHAGALGHFLSGEMDAVFLLGLNDGVLSRDADSLLSEEERRLAQAGTGAYLGMTDESRALFAKTDVKSAMTLPRELLFLSYAKTDPAGKALRPLDLLSVLQNRLFETLPETPVPFAELPMSAAQALSGLSDVLRGYADGAEDQLPTRWRDRLARLLGNPDTAPAAMRLLHAADYRVHSVPLAQEVARQLFNDRTLSVSRLEEFAACPFRHFVDYGLKPEIIKDWGIEPVDLGVLFHRSLQNFAALAAQKAAYPHISAEEAQAMADEAVAPLLTQAMDGPMGETPRGLAGFDRARRIIRRACATVTTQLAAGSFSLYRAEAVFGDPDPESLPPVTLSLKDGTEVTLHGKIDRIDRYDSENGPYLRVVDYKSSANSLQAAQTWWGLQLQLMIYLDAAVGGVKGARPAGAFYFHVSDPLARIDSDLNAEAEAEILRQLQMKGVVLADEDVLRAMDQGDDPIAIPAALTRGGGVRKDARALDAMQLDALLQHARAQAAELAESLYAGNTDILPVQEGDALSCEKCNYGGICGFDVDARGAQARELPEMSLDDLRQRLSGEPESPATSPAD